MGCSQMQMCISQCAKVNANVTCINQRTKRNANVHSDKPDALDLPHSVHVDTFDVGHALKECHLLLQRQADGSKYGSDK